MRVKLSAETLRNELVRRIEEISGEDLLKCYQCGKCAAGCPAAFAMDMLPSQVIPFAQLATHYHIRSVPTFMVFVAGEVQRRWTGVQSKAWIENLLRRVGTAGHPLEEDSQAAVSKVTRLGNKVQLNTPLRPSFVVPLSPAEMDEDVFCGQFGCGRCFGPA